jgi:Rod binding domain-containing protein
MFIDGFTGQLAPAGGDRAMTDITAKDDEARRAELRAVAVEFESVFLAQMLDHAGVGKTPKAFGGGVGEDAFRGHLIGEQARLMADRGGIGLAETIFQAMAEREGLEP